MNAERTEVVDASPAECWAAAIAFDTYPDWQSAVRKVEVHERDGHGRGTLVEFRVDAKIKTVRYVLRYHFDEPGRLWWDYVEGDVRSVSGDFTFDDLGDGTTRATYRLDIDPGRFVPPPVKKVLADGVMRTVVRELKDHVERS